MHKRKSSRIMLFLIGVLVLYGGYILVDQQRIIHLKSAEIKSIQSQIEEQHKIMNELKAQKEALESDPYIEKIAREKLGMVKPGEKVFIDVNK